MGRPGPVPLLLLARTRTVVHVYTVKMDQQCSRLQSQHPVAAWLLNGCLMSATVHCLLEVSVVHALSMCLCMCLLVSGSNC